MSNFRAEVDAMVAAVNGAPELYRPAQFWIELGETHLKQLEQPGFDHFKRTVNTRYFNWKTTGILAHQLSAVLRHWLAHPDSAVFTATLERARGPAGCAEFNPVTAKLYAVYVAMYADLLNRLDPARTLDRLEEPSLGDPFVVRHRDHNISQDLCNSVHELFSLTDGLDLAAFRHAPVAIAELGAGYGRLGDVILRTLPRATYTIIDIPPALYVSQRYLATLFTASDRQPASVFRFRPFDHFADVREEFEAARIRFLAPHQLELLPAACFDWMVNISSLHEMTRPQVENYLMQFDRLCRGRVYTKQWRVSRARSNGCTLREQDYPVPRRWRVRFQRRHPIQRMFFHALYELGDPHSLRTNEA